MAKKCSAGHGLSVWNEFDANGTHYAFWGCPKYKELKCKAKQVEDTDEKFINQVEYPGEKREKIDEPNWDEIARGKVRHGVAVAFIEKGAELMGNETDDGAIKREMNLWVEWIMTNK